MTIIKVGTIAVAMLLAGCGSGSGGGPVPGAAPMIIAPQPASAPSAGGMAGPSVLANASVVDFEGGPSTVSVVVSPGLGSVQAVFPPGNAFPLSLSGEVWTGVVQMPGNGDANGQPLLVTIPIQARDAAGQVVTGSTVVTVLPPEPAPAP
jgi:hypothetical protein